MNINSEIQDIFVNIENFLMELPLAAFVVNRERGIYRANMLLVKMFGYENSQEVSHLLEENSFLSKHFPKEVLADLHSSLRKEGMIKNWPITGQCCGGLLLQIQAVVWSKWLDFEGIPDNLVVVFTPLGFGDVSLAPKPASKNIQEESEMVDTAKNEFLSNISHELRTPLNIVCGMLGVALEDEDMGEDMRGNLGMAKEAADGLLNIVNDVITMASVKAGKIAADVVVFSPGTLLLTLQSHFSRKAQARGMTITIEPKECLNTLVEGGHNLISMAMDKIIDNAVKFNDKEQGSVTLKCNLLEENGVSSFYCGALDNGPGLEASFIASQELFRQGDGSMVRKHGGLGLGLRLASSLVDIVGGRLVLSNSPEGGAEVGVIAPVALASID